MENDRTRFEHLSLQGGADLGPLTRNVEIVDRGSHVQSGPAHHHRGAAARLDVGDRPTELLLETSHREGFAGLHKIHQMMADRSPFALGELGGSDVHPPVDLHGIHRDQFHGPRATRGRFGDVHRQSRLAAGGRPENG